MTDPRSNGHGHRSYDLLVLGAGSAAFAAAITAAEAGFKVGVVESGTLGGTCVNVGCVPSKALLKAAELHWAAAHHSFSGLRTSAGAPDLGALVAQKDELVSLLRQVKYADLVEAYGFEVVAGQAAFVSPSAVAVDGETLSGSATLIATGSSPLVPPIPGLADAGYLTSATALELTELPRRLAVIGAGSVGLELGQYFLHLGSDVSFFEMAGRIAPFEEPEISAALAEAFRHQGANVFAPAQVRSVERSSEGIRLHAQVEGDDVVRVVDQVLVATGRRPNTEGLIVERAGVDLDARGAVVIDEYLRTSNPAVYAAGDVTASPQFVYVAAHQGALAAENALLQGGRRLDLSTLPRVTFTSPPVAAVGLTEADADAAGHRVTTSVLPISAVPRAIVNRETHGLVKLVADGESDRLLGVSIMAEGAGEVIQAAVLALKYGATTAELATTFAPYLTMAEALKLAAQTFTRDVSRLSCCAG